MPHQFALLICIFLILLLFRMDRKKNENVSHAVWIPFIWLFLAGSRYASQWLNLGAPPNIESLIDYTEGSPIDRIIFLTLIGASVVVLLRRNLNWNDIIKNNLLIWLFLLYALISVLWSDYPFVAFKRWFKTMGTVSMVLVVLTERHSYAAFGFIMKRLAFLILPVSILFIKYYPDLGRTYHMGMPMYTGITLGKNCLGEACLILCMYFCWSLFFNCKEENEVGTRSRLFLYLLMLTMIGWLLYVANSATALACVIAMICLFSVSRFAAVEREPRRIMVLCFLAVALYALMQITFNIQDILVAILGRRPDLTTRRAAWEALLSMAKNPILGYGWQSFWLGERRQIAIEISEVMYTHNGYLDIYLNLGVVGFLLLLGWILSGFINVWRYLAIDYTKAMLRLCCIIIVLLHSLTEATLFGVSNMLVILLFATIEINSNSRLEYPNSVASIPIYNCYRSVQN
jgi:exopolysaccharide production protein ExoQ